MINEKNNIRLKIFEFFDKKGIMHLIITGFILLSIILFAGQLITHFPQLIHLFWLIDGYKNPSFFSNEMALTEQTHSQTLQPIHFFVSQTLIIFECLF